MEPRHRRPNPVEQLHAVRRMWIESRIEEPLDEAGPLARAFGHGRSEVGGITLP